MLRSLAAVLLIASTLGAVGTFALLVPDDCVTLSGEAGGSENDDCEQSCLLCACCVRQPPSVAGRVVSLGAALVPAGFGAPLDLSLPPPPPTEILHVPKRS